MKPIPVEDSKMPCEIYPFQMGYLPPKFIKKAQDELKESPETRKLCIEQLRELIRKDNFLNESCITDDYLLQYLRGRKHNVQKAYSVFKKAFVFYKKQKQYLMPPDPVAFQHFVDSKGLSCLPYRDKDGCAVILVRLSRWEPSEIDITELIKMIILLLTCSLGDPMTQVNGYKVIFDFKCNPLKYLRFCTPHYLFLLYHGTQECLPARFKAIHIINPSLVFKMAWPIIYPFLSEKLKKRVMLHDNVSKLHNYFHDKILPVEYGGQQKEYDVSDWYKQASLPELVKYLLHNLADVHGL